MYALWTEHEDTGDGSWTDVPPTSSEVNEVREGLPLVSCGDKPRHFMLRYLGSHAECKAVYDRLNEVGWPAWLAVWKKWQQQPVYDTPEKEAEARHWRDWCVSYFGDDRQRWLDCCGTTMRHVVECALRDDPVLIELDQLRKAADHLAGWAPTGDKP